MTIEMKVPSVGESVTEVTIASWVKKEGDFVKMDEVICELESDKATFELPAEADGILRIIGKEGDTLSIGNPICNIETSNDKAIESENQDKKLDLIGVSNPIESEEIVSEVFEVKVPTVGESITEVTIASWVKKEGDFVNMDEIICELESDKATFELPSPYSGILKILTLEGKVVLIGGVIASIQTNASKAIKNNSNTEPAIANAAETTKIQSSTGYAEGHPSPAASKILAEKGISASAVEGTGPGGRVTKEDAVSAKQEVTMVATTPTISQIVPKNVELRASRREKMSSLRKTIAKRLVAVKNETAMLTTFNEVDMKPIMDLRKQYKDKFKDIHGVGLGFMSFFTKACSISLKEFPVVNAYIDGDEVVYNEFADISIAVSAPRGLVVPVIRNAEKMSFAEIEAEVMRLALKARDNKLTVDEMTGGTFTITNGGIFGSMLSTPIINAPQSAILGMHNIVERPVAINGAVEIRPIMYVALSYDHRTIDGKDSVGFLVRVKQLLEDPMRMLLQV